MWSKKDHKLGRLAGRAWADSGRSIAAVEAVVDVLRNIRQRQKLGYADDGELGAELYLRMRQEIGDDEEFLALEHKSDDFHGGFYIGVCEIAKEWRAR